MSDLKIPDDLVSTEADTTIVLVVLDGLGGLPHPETGLTELEAARTPALDALAAESSLGSHIPVVPGVTPGSGPAHLALFGYDPLVHTIGRGALSALGIDFPLQPGDLAARLNLATFDGEGRVLDRRAGRPSDAEARAIVDEIRDGISMPEGVELFLEHEKEHRAVLVLRAEGLGPDLTESDPLREGVPADEVRALDPASERSAELVRSFLDRTREIRAGHDRANGFLARGFARFERYPSVKERYGVDALALAKYPMYRGVARLVGMEVRAVPGSDEETVTLLERDWGSADLYFLHFKDPDSRGHDGDYDGKVAAIEAVDRLIPRIVELAPDVIALTGDHSTPTQYREHSWHPVPLLVKSAWARPSASSFGERACASGELGILRGTDLISLLLASARRLEKLGA